MGIFHRECFNILANELQLSISCIDSKPDSINSNRADVARRLILTSGNFSDRVTNWLGCKDMSDATDGAFVRYPATEGLAWRDRLRLWTRWTTATSKETESQEQPVQASREAENVRELLPASSPSDKNVPDIHRQEPEHLTQSRKSRTYPHWSDEFRVDSSILIGSILHSHPNSFQSLIEGSQSIGPSSNVIRTFSTAVPHLSRLLTSARILRRKPVESFFMRFQPNPFFPSPTENCPIGSKALSAFPPIEMRFSIEPETKILNLEDVQAILSQENSDLMLPDYPVDLRFLQKTRSRLRVLRNGYPQGIIDFLEKSTLDITKLETPPSLTIPIASYLCKDPGFEIFGSKNNDAATQDVEYLFAGLEIRKTLVFEFEGWRLLYTSIEAGKAGGRRGELTLRPIRRPQHGESGEEPTEHDFIQSALRLAEGLDARTTARKVETSPVRMVKSSGGKDLGGGYTYFAKRVKISDWPVSETEDDESKKDLVDDNSREKEERGEQDSSP